MTGPREPRTCSHPIYARTLTGVYQVVRMFSPCYFHVIISVGILESNSLSLSTRSRTKWTITIHILWEAINTQSVTTIETTHVCCH